ncbi:MAG: Gfo/Idh/MocA family oxidoreductase [Thermoguttaceae bacterium]|jgi:predicted dehydrogenase|nr:Gfo/Idh/MocA family oxidoreductase [Thermoguttaceae bacterium]
MSTELSRRQFLDQSKRTTLGLAAGVTILRTAQSVRAAPANEKLILAAVGTGGRGGHLAKGFVERGDCHYAYFADVDIKKAGARADGFGEAQGGANPKPIQDFREALDDKTVDAIISATPDHWHALSTVWACQAGKDVYVEKPASQSAWEGRKMVEAARKYNRVVQLGTQNRSAPYNMAARKFIEDGGMGNIHMCRIYNQKLWGNRPAVPDSDPPEGLNWDYWNGPAPEQRYNATLHRGWHHFWRYSGGDIANDASHQIDLARWLCGVTYPKQVCSMGGRYASEGALETPDSQFAIYEFDNMVVSFELTLYTPYMLKTDGVIRDTDMFPYWPQNATRIELYGTDGVMYVGRHGGGWQYYIRPKDRQPVVREQMYGRFPDPEHKEDFVKCVRDRSRPTADIEEGHLSALLIHYANISYRLGGERLVIDPKTEHVVGNDEAMKLFRREYRAPYVIEDEV